MATDTDILPLERPRALHFEWTWPLFLRPRQTLAKATEANHGTWLAPLLILSLLAIIAILVAGPIRQAASASAVPTLPQDFQYWSPEQQQQYMQSASTSSSPVFTYIFPAISELARIWVGWLLLAAVLHLGLTLAGSRGTMTQTLNLVGWAGLPAALRYLVQLGSLLFARQLIASPGLSGFAPTATDTLSRLLGAFLPFVDLYLLWMIVLIVVGVRSTSGISLFKAWSASLVSALIVLALMALPAYFTGQLGNVNMIRPFGF